MDTLEAALWCLLGNNTYNDTVLAAVNLGGDTDTTGCVAGGIAGLFHGFKSINPVWFQTLPRHAEIDRLLSLFCPKS